MLNFKGFFLTEQNYNELLKWIQNNKANIGQIIQQMQQRNPDGQGGNANFYKIPNSPFGVRIIRSNYPEANPQLRPVTDFLPDDNFGQPIAQYGDNIQIVKLQSGIPAGMPYKAKTGDQKAVEQFANQLQIASQIPEEEYARLLQSVMKLNSKGYVIDPSKPGNLLIDPETNKFNLVDINKNSNPNYQNTAGEIIVMLLNNYHFSNYFKDDPEKQKFAQQIIKKVELASEKTGFPMGQGSSLDYSYKLSGLN